ncbi:MAG: hypothetical protein QGI45_10625 [Myxococcota bacterium]|jgi:hypothetical protein|nr:hypothetical protein [Myxococcota bacterium]
MFNARQFLFLPFALTCIHACTLERPTTLSQEQKSTANATRSTAHGENRPTAPADSQGEFVCGTDDEEMAEVLRDERQRHATLLGDGGGASLAEAAEPLGVGPRPLMTILIEVGEHRFSQNEKDNLPALIYGAEQNNESTHTLSVKELFEVHSYGQMSIVGLDGETGGADDIFGPFPAESMSCFNPQHMVQDVLDANGELLDLSALAQRARLVVIVAGGYSPCWWAGVSKKAYLYSDDFEDGRLHLPITISSSAQNTSLLAHELGHTLGMGHAGMAQCSGTAWNDIPQRENTHSYTGDETCGSRTYADPFGFMGRKMAKGKSHGGAVAKEVWGWLREGEDAPHRIERVEEDGTYFLSALSEEHEAGLKALKVPHGQNKWLYVEYRTRMNQDGTSTYDQGLLDADLNSYHRVLESSNLFSGALLRIGRPSAFGTTTSLLFDGLVNHQDVLLSRPLVYASHNYALPWGESYIDPLTDTRISVDFSAPDDAMLVDVEMGRTDFEAPMVFSYGVDEEASTDCEVTLVGEVEDDSGISEAIVILHKVVDGEDMLLEVPVEVNDGTFSLSYDIYRDGWQRAGLRISDNAQSQGGLAPNNVFDNGPRMTQLANGDPNYLHWGADDDFKLRLPLVRPWAWQRGIHPNTNERRCNTQGPEIVLTSPIDALEVLSPVDIAFRVSDPNKIASLRISYIEEGSKTGGIRTELFEFNAEGQEVEAIARTLQPELEPGIYNMHIEAEDSHGQISALEFTFTVLSPVPFLRGDANFDGAVDITDIIHINNVLSLGRGSFPCEDAADANDDGSVDISDSVYLSSYLYLGQIDTLPEPFESPGFDLTLDDKKCAGDSD